MRVDMALVTRDGCLARWTVRRDARGRITETKTQWLGGAEPQLETVRVLCTDETGYVIPLTGNQWRYVEGSGLAQSFYQALLSGDYRRAHCITCSYPLR
jgi:hypothetical protein